jgi:hypothetical protein
MTPRTFALRSSLSFRPWLTAAAVLSLATGMVFPVANVAAAAPGPHASAVVLAAPAGSGTQKYIAILRNQNTTMAANSASRLSLIKAQQAPVLSRVRAAGGHVLSSTHLLNAVIATMTASQAAALATDPDVAEVVPDGVIPGPSPLASAPMGTSSSAKPSVAVPSCGTPTAPELDPEALTNIKAVQAQALGFTGVGVKVAYLADGVDPTNADFQRNPAYASSGSSAGSPVLTQVDFAGDPAGALTGGAEAFGDASSIGAQGNQAYDLSNFVNVTHPLPAGCDIKVVGVAPGASILALKVFAEDNDTTTSNFLQAVEYAVANGAKVINESFGANNIPDTSLDVIRQADDAAVAAGVTVVVSTGDAGITGTTGSPATDPNVISVGASTTFRSYEQETFGGINDPHTNGRFIDNNISSLSSGGFAQDGGTLDLVAPGDLNWALCSTDVSIFNECTNENGAPSPIQNFGGTSESSPLTAGAAADVIQAYASAHHGNYPSPALVKQILVSTATDIGAPATEQGAGLLNVLAAVKLAQAIKSPSAASSSNVLVGPTQINVVQQPGDSSTEAIKLTNPNSSPIHVDLSTRALTHQVADQTGTFCLQPGAPTLDCPANTGTFPIWSGVVETFQDQSFTVPHTRGLSRLDFTADYQFSGQSSLLHVALFEPDGTYAGYSLPQGLADFARIEVANPPAGMWTAVFFTVQDGKSGIGTSGPIQWDANTLESRSAGSIFPSSLTIGAGKTATAFLKVSSPGTPGDSEQSVVVKTATAQTTIPVTVRTLVHMGRNGGTFNGVLTGGNGRQGAGAQTNTYYFDVPGGKSDIDVSVALVDDPHDLVIGTLVDPHGQTVGYSSNVTTDAGFNPSIGTTMSIYHVNPTPGRWRLVLNWQNPVFGTELSEPFTGAIRFNQVSVSSNLPHSSSAKLSQGSTNTYNVTVTNTGIAPEAFFVDPRRNQNTTLDLPDLNGSATNMTLPLPAGLTFPVYLVPTHTSLLNASLTGTAPVTFDLEYFPGDPDVSPSISSHHVTGQTGPTAASLTLREREVSPGFWLLNPSEVGPYGPTGQPKVTASADLTVITKAFDPTIDSSTGDFWSNSNGLTPDFAPLYVLPGDTATITVTIAPTAIPGTHVSGTLYVGNYNLSQLSIALPNADDLAAIPYSYTVKH